MIYISTSSRKSSSSHDRDEDLTTRRLRGLMVFKTIIRASTDVMRAELSQR